MIKVSVYIETNLKSANVGTGKYGYVVEVLKNGEPVTRTRVEEEFNTTMNQILLIACIRALEILNKSCEITVYTSCQYIVNGINTWMHNWYQADWINAKGEAIKNMDLWKPIYKATEQHLINAEYTKVHNYSVWLQSEMQKEIKESETD